MELRRIHGSHWLVLGVAVLLCTLPFLGKALHIDDPMYLWAAQQITHSPLDFYGFEVNWHGFGESMYEANKNPPLVSFYLAAVGTLLGWSERALHLGMLLPTLTLILAVYGLGRRLTQSPLAAALGTLAMPVVLVSATTLMSDVLMLAIWCLALWLWLEGLDRGRSHWLIGAALLMGLAPLAKYFGLALLPLLGVYTALRERRVGAWLGALAIPLAIVAAYELYLRLRYGWSPLGDIGAYALGFEKKARYGGAERGLVGLLFLGGCLLPSLLAAPLLWRRRVWVGLAALCVAGALLAPALGELGTLVLVDAEGARWGLAFQLSLFGVAGLHALGLAVTDSWRRRDAEAWLLLLWLFGTWFFASYTNWITTARAILPAAPVVALLTVRGLEAARGGAPLDRVPVIWAPVVAGLLVGWLVAHGDARLAESARLAAEELTASYRERPGALYFQGAWGFHAYMERAGAQRLRTDGTDLAPGDLVITPELNTNLVVLPTATVRVLEERLFPVDAWATTLSHRRGAGFYAALWGPLPFSFGPAPAQRYRVFEVVQPYTLKLRERKASSPPR
jgi:4-amino-4-deoxy-L-arabinose transferase-like glycosyltransferase